MQDAGGDGATKRVLAKAQRLLQLKRNAFALRDFREVLEECLKPEASATVRALGFRLAARAPPCAKMDTWQMLVEACVTELAGSQNAPALLAALPLLARAPVPLVLRFLASPEREPMNKLRAALTHDQSDVRCAAIAACARLTVEVAASVLTGDGLLALPFESHEARVCCQQDVWTIVVDTWKLIFQALFLLAGDQRSPGSAGAGTAGSAESVGAAFVALRMLFSRGTAVNAFSLKKECPLAQSAVNDLVSAVFKEAFPRVLAIQAAARKLPMRHQTDALAWVAMLLYMMMDKSGARCPGISLPYLDIDLESAQSDDDDDDSQLSGSTRRARVDQLATDVLEAWICPLFARKASLAQCTALCRAAFLLLSHPLLAFARIKRAPMLAHEFIAQCFYHRSSDSKLEMSQMLVKTFAWVAADTCVQLFVRVVEALSLMERETDRQGLIQLLADSVCDRVVRKQEFLLLESLCALEFFRQPQGASRLSPRASGAQVFRCLAQALALPDAPPSTAPYVQVAQLTVLKAFQRLLVTKAAATATATAESTPSSQLCYVALLTRHLQSALRSSALLFRESLEFFQYDLQQAWGRITCAQIRVQLLWIGIQLAARCQAIPVEILHEQLASEAQALFSSSDRERELNSEPQTKGASAAFGDGRLGGGSAGVDSSSSHGEQLKYRASVETFVAVSECAMALAQLQPQLGPRIQYLCEQLKQGLAATTPAGSLASNALYTHERFHPAHVFVPQKHQEPLATTTTIASPPSGMSFERDSSAVVTGSSDPFSIRVSYRQPVPGHEDVVALCVSCCNVTNLPLGDFEVQIRPLGAVKCVDASNDLKLRMLQGGSASGNLPSFGVFRGEKRFQLQKFTQAAFFFQVVFPDLDAVGDGGGHEQPRGVPVRLAPSEKFVVHFDALFRLPKPQFTSGAFFQRVWQGNECKALSFCQRLAKHCGARVVLICDLLIDTPIHIHIAFLAETRWDEFIAASVTLTREAVALAAQDRWSGIVEFRATGSSVGELAKAPQDALSAFCGSDELRITSDSCTAATSDAQQKLQRAEAQQPAFAGAESVFSTRLGTTEFPGADFTASSPGGRVGSNKWPTTASPFDQPFEFSGGDQLRPAAATTAVDDPWM
ncbi:hypothetical protein PybrP1_009439 [[Pythium] brassicae (nom. inval.)]|nr:hypothetical protein PybrP1_009439 [[Pythium] brassicae (nom. inval.)]